MTQSAVHEDAAWVRRCLSGDRTAFEHIVRHYQSLLCSVAFGYTGNRGLSEEVAQETFVVAWSRLARLRDPDRLGAWLCAIARNVSRSAVRRHRRDAALRARAAARAADAVAPSPREEAVGAEEERLLWDALARIPEPYRIPLVLYYREGMSASEVAAALGMAPPAVHQRLSRGRKLLREEMAAFVEDALRRKPPRRDLLPAVVAALPAGLPPAPLIAGWGVAWATTGVVLALATVATTAFLVTTFSVKQTAARSIPAGPAVATVSQAPAQPEEAAPALPAEPAKLPEVVPAESPTEPPQAAPRFAQLFGRVTDPRGRILPGIRVVCNGADPPRSTVVHDDGWIDYDYRDRSFASETTADNGGFYRFSDLSGGEYRVWPLGEKGGLLNWQHTARVTLTPGQERRLDLVLYPLVTVRGTVHTVRADAPSDGDAATVATLEGYIRFTCDDGKTTWGSTAEINSAIGSFECGLPGPGRYRIAYTPSLQGDRTAIVPPLEGPDELVVDGEGPYELSLALPPLLESVQCLVFDNGRRPLRGLQLALQRPDRMSGFSAFVYGDGVVTFDRVPSAEYVCVVRRAGDVLFESLPFNLDAHTPQPIEVVAPLDLYGEAIVHLPPGLPRDEVLLQAQHMGPPLPFDRVHGLREIEEVPADDGSVTLRMELLADRYAICREDQRLAVFQVDPQKPVEIVVPPGR